MDYPSNFIKTIIEEDIKNKKYETIVTRFPPEPNGFLHIGHARAIITNFELAKSFGGYTYLRYDDTNPSKEDEIYVKAIEQDIRWLGYEPKSIFYASNYFQIMFEKAILLIEKGLAYADFSTQEEISRSRGDLHLKGIASKYRSSLSIKENLEIFNKMKDGLYNEGEVVLRAKIDLESNNINMRDPVIYRIVKAIHHNTKDKWIIYPMYDFAHPLEDAIEGITHSLCSLEFEDHRPLYDWVVQNCEMKNEPRQIEFGRLTLENTVMSKRHLRTLVESKKVSGWDDPRMPTIAGLRRRGYTKEAIKEFVFSCGLSKVNGTISVEMLESAIRNDLSIKARRVNGIINPLKITITNYPDDQKEEFLVPYHPDDEALGSRIITFSKNLFIERNDFSEVIPDPKFKRLSLGLEVRLMHAYFIKAEKIIKDIKGNILEVLCTYDVETKSGSGFSKRKPNGTINFLSIDDAINLRTNIYSKLVTGEIKENVLDAFNENSLQIKYGYCEKSLLNFKSEDKFQFIRNGYYVIDSTSTKDLVTVNEIVQLKSSIK